MLFAASLTGVIRSGLPVANSSSYCRCSTPALGVRLIQSHSVDWTMSLPLPISCRGDILCCIVTPWHKKVQKNLDKLIYGFSFPTYFWPIIDIHHWCNHSVFLLFLLASTIFLDSWDKKSFTLSTPALRPDWQMQWHWLGCYTLFMTFSRKMRFHLHFSFWDFLSIPNGKQNKPGRNYSPALLVIGKVFKGQFVLALGRAA